MMMMTSLCSCPHLSRYMWMSVMGKSRTINVEGLEREVWNMKENGGRGMERLMSIRETEVKKENNNVQSSVNIEAEKISDSFKFVIDI